MERVTGPLSPDDVGPSEVELLDMVERERRLRGGRAIAPSSCVLYISKIGLLTRRRKKSSTGGLRCGRSSSSWEKGENGRYNMTMIR